MSLLAVTVVVMAVLASHGAFARVAIQEEELEPMNFVYRTAPSGDFKSVERITTELSAELEKIQVHGRPLDVFFPGGADAHIGFLVSATDADKTALLADPPARRVIEGGRFLTHRFPFRSRMSFMIGYVKVDPALRRYRESNGLSGTWAGTINEGPTVLYFQPIQREAPR